MQELAGKTAFITGGASGIGFALAKAALGEGMRVVIVDVDANALQQAEVALAGANTELLALQLDVTDRDQYAEIAAQVEQRFGAVHLLCNNAGVYRGGALDQVSFEDWDWVLGVNVGGVVNGVQTFANKMKGQGEGHIVNTASMAGMISSPGLGVYNTSKFAVVGLSEALQVELAEHNVGVSVLCPGMVRTRILESERTRPESFLPSEQSSEVAAQQQSSIMQAAMETGIDADEVAGMVLDGVKANRFYLFPHPELKSAVVARFDNILGEFGEADPDRLAAIAQMGSLIKD